MAGDSVAFTTTESDRSLAHLEVPNRIHHWNFAEILAGNPNSRWLDIANFQSRN